MFQIPHDTENAGKGWFVRSIYRSCFRKIEACNFIKKLPSTQAFSSEFFEIFKNTLFTLHLRDTITVQPSRLHQKNCEFLVYIKWFFWIWKILIFTGRWGVSFPNLESLEKIRRIEMYRWKYIMEKHQEPLKFIAEISYIPMRQANLLIWEYI